MEGEVNKAEAFKKALTLAQDKRPEPLYIPPLDKGCGESQPRAIAYVEDTGWAASVGTRFLPG